MLAIVFSLFVSSAFGRQYIECDDAYECQGKTLKGNLIECSGFGGCDSASITSKGARGYIDCTGSKACNEAGSLSTGKSMFCQGYYACYAAGEVSGKTVQCSGSYACSNVDLITAGTTVHCGGLKACEKTVIEAGKDIYCDGLSSCNGAAMDAEGQDILCTGNKACIGVKVSAAADVECSGNVACKKAKISANKVNCHGSNSCQNAKLSAEEVNAFGYNALSESEVENEKNKTRLKVSLSGEAAGTDSTVVCKTGVDCEIECTDSCPSLEVLSFSGSDTTVTASGEACTEGSTDEACPTVKVSSSECEDRELLAYLENKREMNLRRHINDNDDADRLLMSDYLHDAAEEIDFHVQDCEEATSCQNQVFIDEDAECYGRYACAGATINQSDTNAVISAYASESFFQGFVNSRGTLYCHGKLSCAQTNYMFARVTECGAYESCAYQQNGISGNSLNCEGTLSCAYNDMMIQGNLKCLAGRSCYESTIISGLNVVCDGNYGCSDGAVTATTIKCTGFAGCSGSTLVAAKNVYVDGEKGAAQTNIIAPKIRVYGYFGLAGALVDSNYSSLTMQLFGDMAGVNAQITCREGSKCKIDCETSGCKNMDVICLDGSDCRITPVECRQKRSPKQIEGIYCPSVTYSESKQDDERVLKEVQQQRLARMNDEMYKKVMEELNFVTDQDDNIITHEMYKQIAVNDDKWDTKHFDGILAIAVLVLVAVVLFYFALNYCKAKQDDKIYYQQI